MLPQQNINRREIKTTQPRFRKIVPTCKTRVQTSKKVQRSQGKGLDSSKQNIYFEEHLSKVKSLCKIDQATMVTRYLNNLRRGCDEIAKNSRKDLWSMRIKRRDISLMKYTHSTFAQDKDSLFNQIEKRQQHLDEVKQKYQDVKMETKILQNMVSRMKKDQMFYKNLARIKDEEAHGKLKQVKLYQHKILQEDQSIQKIHLQLKESLSAYQNNKDLRINKFSDYTDRITEVKERNKFVQERQQRTYQLQSIELNDTMNQKNIYMREILLAHRVADSLLEAKVTTLLKQNQDLQAAFHAIKLKTSISDPKLLTSKFFSYNQTSEKLLQSIRTHEHKLEQLTSKKKTLSATLNSVKNQGLSLDENPSNNEAHIIRKDKLLAEINYRRLLIEQITKWVDKKSDEVGIKGSGSLAERINKICHKLSKIEQECNKLTSTSKIPIMGVRFKKLGKEMSTEQLQGRFREIEQMNDSNIIEEEYMKTSRVNLKKQKNTKVNIRKQSFLR